MLSQIEIGGRKIGPSFPPLVVVEIGINHEGNLEKAITMVDAAKEVGAECIKIQSHIIEDEMIPNEVIPGNAKVSIWEIIKKCSLSAKEEKTLKEYIESKKMIFLSTPFSRSAADRLHSLGVVAFKIGSGECNNYPLIQHIANYGKPIILSTGMNTIANIQKAVEIFIRKKLPFAILHCTSIYPTPYEKVHLNAITELQEAFPNAVIGLSDHSPSIYPCLGAVTLGASILERHFTFDKSWPGPDIPVSMDPKELKELIYGSKAIFHSLKGSKEIFEEEKPTINFAYSCVVSIKPIKKGEILSKNNIWVKRPGTGEIKAVNFEKVLGKRAIQDIEPNTQIRWSYLVQ